MQYRHGDVQIVRVDSLPDDVKKLNRKVLAYGEATGHAHRIDVGELFETKDGELYLKVSELGKVTHEEHRSITLNPGVYRVGIKRQFNPESGWERVQD